MKSFLEFLAESNKYDQFISVMADIDKKFPLDQEIEFSDQQILEIANEIQELAISTSFFRNSLKKIKILVKDQESWAFDIEAGGIDYYNGQYDCPMNINTQENGTVAFDPDVDNAIIRIANHGKDYPYQYINVIFHELLHQYLQENKSDEVQQIMLNVLNGADACDEYHKGSFKQMSQKIENEYKMCIMTEDQGCIDPSDSKFKKQLNALMQWIKDEKYSKTEEL